MQGGFLVTFHTNAKFEDFWHDFCQKYELCSAILHSVLKALLVMGKEVNVTFFIKTEAD